ncbi:hypothetical protein [Paenibacillus sp. HGF7]|nr:hypothetical protein [Paenibacillus sp. HGF7]MBV6712867.1 hypothetical protein [Paenibacillus chitinolyticus]
MRDFVKLAPRAGSLARMRVPGHATLHRVSGSLRAVCKNASQPILTG